jgi:hypothetical protein
MNRNICLAAFAAGLAVVLWVGVGYLGTQPLALAMTAIIGVAYVAGALEMARFQRATESLVAALDALPAALPGSSTDAASSAPERLAAWLEGLHPSLRGAVRLRVEGERTALPGPAVTPYLVGLLVMLGMLGTFLGMVVTLNGAVLALETTTDLPTIRAALAAPVKGLGLAFGTSVAGVAASAMLGLIAALCRRERLAAGRRLDAKIAGELRGFSLVHQRQETFRALQAQSRALPEVAERLVALMAQIERNSASANERLLADSERFHREAQAAYGELARSVDRSLKESLVDSARLAGATIQPAVESTLAGLARETTALHERLQATAGAQLDRLADGFERSVAAAAGAWDEALARREAAETAKAGGLRRALDDFAQRNAAGMAALIERTEAAQAALRADFAAREEARQAALTQSLADMGAALGNEWRQAGEATLAQQQAICDALERTAQDIAAGAEAHAGRTIDEIARLMQGAVEAPRVAAEVIGQLRQQLSESIVRDNALLEERARIMEGLAALLDAIGSATGGQREAIDALLATAGSALERTAGRFAEDADAGAARLADAAAEVSGGAVEVASLAEAFSFAVQRFGETSEKLAGSLERIEGALEKSLVRSDEQLAYYVAQARELIDLSLLSQQRVVDELRRLPAPVAAGAA